MPDTANQISSITNGNRQPRFSIAIGAALMLGFGTLVFLAAASVLGIGLWSARENTIELLRDREEYLIDLLVERVRGHLDPVVKANAHLAELIGDRAVSTSDLQQLARSMRNTMAATPQVVGMAFVTPGMRVLRYQRDTGSLTDLQLNGTDNPEIVDELEKAKGQNGPYWGNLIRSERLKSTLLNRRAPVRVDGRFIGILISAISLAELSQYLKEEDQKSSAQNSFLLYGRGHVLAHPSMADGDYPMSARQPIPAIDQMDDPVLRNIWNEGARRQGVVRGERTREHLLDLGDDTYVVMYRQIEGLAAVPLQVGAYVKLERNFGPQFIRLWRALVAGLLIVLVAVVGALWLGRRMARPIGELAGAAENIRALQLDPAPSVERSRLKELDNAATAFNSMIAGLKWFETYVPRSLVRSLLADNEESAVLSAERDVTVLFTDIRNFTARAEAMGAAETAEFLNCHFSLVAACVENEGGTIDKYIGDSVMAFWGAPHPVIDHAARACRAAIAIRHRIAVKNAEDGKLGQPALRMGIGVHSGKVLAGNIGAPGRVNYTLVGDAVNLAQRLEQLCKPFAEPDNAVTILISRDVAEAVKGVFDTEGCGTQSIRGRAAALDVFRLR